MQPEEKNKLALEIWRELVNTHLCWKNMRSRCSNVRDKSYVNYGGRGIKVCARWESFDFFLADMGLKPANLSLDRINNDGDYEPTNCRWTNSTEQNRNRRGRKVLNIDGVSVPLYVLVERLGVNYKTVNSRLAKGWSIEDAVQKVTQKPRGIHASKGRGQE
jgi:hypothetical protein